MNRVMNLSALVRVAGCAAAGFLALAAAQTPAAAQTDASPIWRHGIIAPKSDAGFLVMAAKNGFAEREGIRLDLLKVKDDQVGLKALIAGEIDSYEGGVQGAISADIHGADVRIIGCHWPIVPHGLMVKAGIGQMTDLKGRAIAVSAPGSFPDVFARVVMSKFNLSPADVMLAAVGGDRERYMALVGGVVDAAVVSNEYLPLPSSRNFKMLATGQDAGPNFLRVCMFSTGRVLASRHEDAIRFLTAQSRALHYAMTHRDETLKLTFEESDARSDDPRPAFVFDDAVKTGAVAPDLPIPIEKIAWMQDQLVSLGQIPKAGDVSRMVDLGIRAEAMKRVGR
jgi:NitT/TauT family transport system substrate-binding protein